MNGNLRVSARVCFWTGLAVSCAFATSALGGLPVPENPRWKPVRDDVYLQEVGFRILTQRPLVAASVFDGTLYAGDEGGVLRLEGQKLVPAGGPQGKVIRLKTVGGALWAFLPDGLWALREGSWSKAADGAFVDVCLHGDAIVLASSGQLYRLENGNPVPICEEERTEERPRPIPILGVESYCETLYVRHAGQLAFLEENKLKYDDVQDWGHLPLGSETRDFLSLGSRLIVATGRGLGVLHGMSWHAITGREGLCYEDTTCLAEGFAGDYWIGTTRGAIRAVNGEYHYFGYERWIPHDRVNAIACGDNVAYIATDGGLGVIRYEPYTLQKKAAWYENWLDEWGQKRLGFVHTLVWVPERKEYVRFLSDNDLGWTCHYLDALCFQYAVTKDAKVREQAVDVFRSVKWAEEIVPIDGYPARAIYAVGENAIKATTGSAGLPAEWNPTEDGKWEWKGDTSSDEVDSHMYSTPVFLELAAQGKEKDAAKEHMSRILTHIIDNGWVLRDLDGKPTRWARWDPEYLQRAYGYDARGLNGLEALSFATSTHALTADHRFLQGKRQLLDWGYQNETLRQKLVFPVVTHFDDRLAFLAYYPLLTYEFDPHLRSIYRRSLERSWEVKRVENMPWFNFIYGALTGNECENGRAAAHLREWPLDCVGYRQINSHRADLQVPAEERNYISDWKPMGPRDIGPQRWSSDFLKLDGGGANRVLDPCAWLDAYWMGRYYGFIEGPTTTDESLLTVPKSNVQRGAAPYQGPPRPDIFCF